MVRLKHGPTEDLIAELEDETASGQFAMIALAVVFDDKQQLILGNHGNQQRLDLLNDFVDEGASRSALCLSRLRANLQTLPPGPSPNMKVTAMLWSS